MNFIISLSNISIEQVLKHLPKQSLRPYHHKKIVPRFALKVQESLKCQNRHTISTILNLQKNLDMLKNYIMQQTKSICVSDFITKEVKSIVPNDKKCLTVHNGIDLNAFSPNRKSSICRKDIGLNENDFVLLFSGRINREKGISELLDAFLSIKEFSNIKLLVIGSSFYGGSCTEDQTLYQLTQRENRLHFKQNIFHRFHTIRPDA